MRFHNNYYIDIAVKHGKVKLAASCVSVTGS